LVVKSLELGVLGYHVFQFVETPSNVAADVVESGHVRPSVVDVAATP
jgi:hypothetical protein